MRTVSEVLRKAVEENYYKNNSYFMCHALAGMCNREVITYEEYLRATSEIETYIQTLIMKPVSPLDTLAYALARAELAPFSSEEYKATLGGVRAKVRKQVCTPIYLDWDSRPFPKLPDIKFTYQ